MVFISKTEVFSGKIDVERIFDIGVGAPGNVKNPLDRKAWFPYISVYFGIFPCISDMELTPGAPARAAGARGAGCP